MKKREKNVPVLVASEMETTRFDFLSFTLSTPFEFQWQPHNSKIFIHFFRVMQGFKLCFSSILKTGKEKKCSNRSRIHKEWTPCQIGINCIFHYVSKSSVKNGENDDSVLTARQQQRWTLQFCCSFLSCLSHRKEKSVKTKNICLRNSWHLTWHTQPCTVSLL